MRFNLRVIQKGLAFGQLMFSCERNEANERKVEEATVTTMLYQVNYS